MNIADVAFAIGKTHEVCEDYGLAAFPGMGPLFPKRNPAFVYGDTPPRALAIVSDGCSSSANTDFGARLLARAAATVYPTTSEVIIQRAWDQAQVLGLGATALDATLLMVQETPEGDALVNVWGDGEVVARRRDGSGFDQWTHTYSHNAPAYLSYLIDPRRLEDYLNVPGTLGITGFEDRSADPRSSISYLLNREEYDLVLVATDGAESFQKREGAGFSHIPSGEVMREFMQFKTLGPGFIHRRLKAFLTKQCVALDWQHYDDIAFGGLVLE